MLNSFVYLLRIAPFDMIRFFVQSQKGPYISIKILQNSPAGAHEPFPITVETKGGLQSITLSDI